MPGVPGSGGPVPKRSDQRRRRNKPTRPITKAPTGSSSKKKAPRDRKRPPCNAHWHPIAKRWFVSLGESGQSKFYEPSDWAMAYLIAESISRDLKPQVVGMVEETGEVIYAVIPMKGASLAAYLKAMSSLLVTEGDRRRAGIELERGAPDTAKPGTDPDVASLDDYRRRVSG